MKKLTSALLLSGCVAATPQPDGQDAELVTGGDSAAQTIIVTNGTQQTLLSLGVHEAQDDGTYSENEWGTLNTPLAPGETAQIAVYSYGCDVSDIVAVVRTGAMNLVQRVDTCAAQDFTLTF